MIDLSSEPFIDEEREIIQDIIQEMSEQEFQIFQKFLMSTIDMNDKSIEDIKIISKLSFKLGKRIALNELKEKKEYVN